MVFRPELLKKRKDLASVQEQVLRSPTEELIQLERVLSLKLYDLMLAEERFYKKKSKISWIKEGDKNTRFFQKLVVVQQHRNTIRSLTNSAGIRLTSFSDISKEAISFFQGLLGAKDEQIVRCNVLQELLQSILPRVQVLICAS